jgi:hypothetical protein
MTVLFRSTGTTLLLVLASQAQAGQVHPEAITFEELVRDAHAIAVVKPARKPRTRQSVDITPAGKARDPARYPPFEFVIHEYEVVKVLKNDGEQKLGKRLSVYPASFDTALHVHREYHLRGISKHWLSRGYEPKQPPSGTSTESVVLFLSRNGKRLSFAAEGAVESSARAEEIAAALARPPQK